MSDDGAEAFDIEGGGDRDGVITEVTHENLGERLKASCAGICIGLLLFFGSFPLLFWNEDRAVERYDALNEAESQVVSVSSLNIDPVNEGQVVHFSANITNGGDTLVDPTFGIESEGLVLRRYAEMYQWTEQAKTTTKKTTGGGKTKTTTYSYDKRWKTSLVDSSRFKKSGYTNPSSMEFEGGAWYADPIMIGAYQLPQDLAGRIGWEEPMSVDVENITDQSLQSRATTSSGGLYFGSSPTNPQIGDQRVSFAEAPEAIITIVGVQNGNTLSAFVSETGEGGDILLFKQGNYSATAMFDAAEEENAVATWLFRFAGWAIMALGLYLIFRPIEVFADVIPCVGSIVGCGLIFMAVLISAVLSTFTIAIAWLVAHPEIGAIFLAVALVVVGGCAFGIKKLGKRKGNGDNDDSPLPSPSDGKIPESAPEAAIPTVSAVNEQPTVYASAPVEPTVYASAPVQSTAYASAAPAYATAAPTVYAMPEGGGVAPGTAEHTVYSTPQPYVPK